MRVKFIDFDSNRSQSIIIKTGLLNGEERRRPLLTSGSDTFFRRCAEFSVADVDDDNGGIEGNAVQFAKCLVSDRTSLIAVQMNEDNGKDYDDDYYNTSSHPIDSVVK